MRITETAVFLLCRILDISSDLAQFHRYTNYEVITKKNSSHVPAAVFKLDTEGGKTFGCISDGGRGPGWVAVLG